MTVAVFVVRLPKIIGSALRDKRTPFPTNDTGYRQTPKFTLLEIILTKKRGIHHASQWQVNITTIICKLQYEPRGKSGCLTTWTTPIQTKSNF